MMRCATCTSFSETRPSAFATCPMTSNVASKKTRLIWSSRCPTMTPTNEPTGPPTTAPISPPSPFPSHCIDAPSSCRDALRGLIIVPSHAQATPKQNHESKKIHTLTESRFESNLATLELIARGKVRDIYRVDADRLLIVATDRLS